MTKRAVLAGGCFWGMQDLIRKLPGVIETRVGYTGGDVPNATYRNHGTHAEGIEIIFDPERISYRRILELFFQIHDPTTKNRQGNDVGTSYRSAIYYADDEQKRIAEETIADVEASGLWPGKVVTEVEPVGDFWEAEPDTRITWSAIPTATRAISRAPTGSCPGGRRPSERPEIFVISSDSEGLADTPGASEKHSGSFEPYQGCAERATLTTNSSVNDFRLAGSRCRCRMIICSGGSSPWHSTRIGSNFPVIPARRLPPALICQMRHCAPTRFLPIASPVPRIWRQRSDCSRACA